MNDLFSYPNSPGFKEHTTSRDAAKAIEPRVGTLRAQVLFFLSWFEGTPDEIAEAICSSILSVRPRVTELYRMGLIERTGARRKNASGMNAHVYRITRERSV